MAHKNKHLCPCGSGKRMKLCCSTTAPSTKLAFTPSKKLEMRQQAEALDRAGKHLEACEVLELLLAVSPLNPLIWNDLGIQYEASGQHEKAFGALRRGHMCESRYPPILYNLGKFTLDRFLRLHDGGELGRLEGRKLLAEAAKFLNRNLDLDPNNAPAHYNLALVYALSEDERRAEMHMRVALRLEENLEPPSGWLLR